MGALRILAARLQWTFASLGALGAIGVVLCVAAAIFHLAVTREEGSRLAEIRAELAAARAIAARRPVADAAMAEPAARAFYRLLPAEPALPDMLRTLDRAAADAALDLASAEYRMSREHDAPVSRYQISYSLQGSYLALRRFLAEAMNRLPTLALSDLSLHRDSTRDADLEAEIRFTLYLARP